MQPHKDPDHILCKRNEVGERRYCRGKERTLSKAHKRVSGIYWDRRDNFIGARRCRKFGEDFITQPFRERGREMCKV